MAFYCEDCGEVLKCGDTDSRHFWESTEYYCETDMCASRGVPFCHRTDKDERGLVTMDSFERVQ